MIETMNDKLYDKIDRLFFKLEITLGKKCDKKSKVRYKDIFEEITTARIELKKICGLNLKKINYEN